MFHRRCIIIYSSSSSSSFFFSSRHWMTTTTTSWKKKRKEKEKEDPLSQQDKKTKTNLIPSLFLNTFKEQQDHNDKVISCSFSYKKRLSYAIQNYGYPWVLHSQLRRQSMILPCSSSSSSSLDLLPIVALQQQPDNNQGGDLQQNTTTHHLGFALFNRRATIPIRRITIRPTTNNHFNKDHLQHHVVIASYLITLIQRRILFALNSRRHLFNNPYYRLLNGEADGIPGVFVDRFTNVLLIRIDTHGSLAMESFVLNHLTELLQPSAVVVHRIKGRTEKLFANGNIYHGPLRVCPFLFPK